MSRLVRITLSLALLASVTGCYETSPDTPPDSPASSCNAQQRCTAFCIYGTSTWKCDDNRRCVCDYQRDGAEAFVDCIGP